MFKSICLTAALLFSLTTPEAKAVEIKDPENTLVIELKSGEVVIEMLPDGGTQQWRAATFESSFGQCHLITLSEHQKSM